MLAFWALVASVGCRHPAPVEAPAEAPSSWSAPSDALAAYARARMAEEHGALQAADEAFDWVIRFDRSNPYARLHVGSYLLRQDRPAEAREQLTAGLVFADLPELRLARARAAMALGDQEEALADLTVAADADRWEAFALLDGLLGELGRESERRPLFERWVSLAPPPGVDAYPRAQLAMDLGEADQAVSDLISVLESGHGSPEVGLLLAELSSSACLVSPAWEWAERGRVAGRKDAGWLKTGARIGIAAGDAEMAQQAAVLLAPDFLVHERIALLASVGDFPAALEVVRRARSVLPADGALAVAEAKLLWARGMLGAAAMSAERAADVAGEAGVRLQVAILVADGRPEDAQRLAGSIGANAMEISAEVGPTFPPPSPPHCGVSELVAESEGAAPCDAVETLRRAERAAPLDVEVLDALASAHEACGQWAQARRIAFRAWDQAPTEERRDRLGALSRSAP